MKDMTVEEYYALDDRLTENVPTLGPNGNGFFPEKVFKLLDLTKTQQKYLTQKQWLHDKHLQKLLQPCFVKN